MDFQNYILPLINYCTPTIGTKWSACSDLFSHHTYEILPGQIAYIWLWIKSQLDRRFHAKIYERSSTHKKWISLVNKVWIIDSDYRWEWIAWFINTTDQTIVVQNWEKICQFEIVKNWYDITVVSKEEFELNETERWEWWFGSTWN